MVIKHPDFYENIIKLNAKMLIKKRDARLGKRSAIENIIQTPDFDLVFEFIDGKNIRMSVMFKEVF